MEISYNKTAVLEYINDINNIGASLQRERDESFNQYNSCKQQYSRLHTEIEEEIRRAYNMIEEAESLQREADFECSSAAAMLSSAETESERAAAQRRISEAQAKQAEAARELAIARAEYARAQSHMNKLIGVWERYQPAIETAATRANDEYVSFNSYVNNGNRDLETYMDSMDKAQAALYGEDTTTGRFSSEVKTSPSFVQSGKDAFSIKDGRNTSSSRYLFKSKDKNTINIVSKSGTSNIVMNIAGEEKTYPYTKSGAAKAYRAAVKSSDTELAAHTNLLFSSIDSNASASMPNQIYVQNTLDSLAEGLSDTLDKELVLAGAEMRKLRIPKTKSSAGEMRGNWLDSTFYMADDFIPKNGNPNNFTVAEIKQNLKDSYGLQVEGIPFKSGVADFSSISVASISTKDIVMRSEKMSELDYDNMDSFERTKVLNEVFAKNRRNQNFDLADKIAAERQIPIMGLNPGYTAAELAKWREGKFTWDEQVNGGYNLVPTVIHGNIAHTGLVSSSNMAVKYFEERANDAPNKYSWNEENAPISLTDLLGKQE